MDALELLEQDHEKMKKLLEEADATTERGVKTREQLFQRIKRDLIVHETIEEEILYPALAEHAKAREIVLEGFEEHHVADMLLAEIEELPFDDERWGAKLSVLMEGIEHHIEEEERDMFAKARNLFDKEELEDLGSQMEERKREVMRELSS
jgi:hypothetical protein